MHFVRKALKNKVLSYQKIIKTCDTLKFIGLTQQNLFQMLCLCINEKHC